MSVRARVTRAVDRAAEGLPNAMERVLCAVATAPANVIREAARLGDLEALTPGGACGRVLAPADMRGVAHATAARRWPHLAAFWAEVCRVRWPHGLPVDHPAWKLVHVPEPQAKALAEADRVLAAAPAPRGAHANALTLGTLRAHVALALALPWRALDRHPSVAAGLDTLTTGTPWSTAYASHK